MSEDYGFEKKYWGDCCNTFDEDQKHYVYARLMGLERSHYSFVLPHISVLDIGGGPSSMLLKCEGLVSGTVVDPINYPEWTKDRYKSKWITPVVDIGENIQCVKDCFDEVWIYNCM